jgi:hypothetical protein
LHVNIATPKSEPPPSSIQFAVTCPACGAEHVGVVARSKEAFDRAARAMRGEVEREDGEHHMLVLAPAKSNK